MCSHAKADTGCPYDPRIDGSWTLYQLYQIGGHWNPVTHRITVDWRTPKNQQTIVWRVIPNSIGPVPGINEFFFPSIYTPCWRTDVGNVGGPGFVLYDAIQNDDNGRFYIGEVGSMIYGETVTPGEPKIPMNPIGNEHYEFDHWVMDCTSGHLHIRTMHTSFYMIGGPGYTWLRADGALMPNCVWTSLEEQPGNPVEDHVYNYVFQQGVGIIDIAWGNLRDHVNYTIDMADGQHTSFEYQAIAWGTLAPQPTPTPSPTP
jgi:hypothetical protein